MKKNIIILGLFASGLAYSQPHLDLEMTSQEYRNHLSELSKNKTLMVEDPAVEASIKLGDRLSKWIAKINASRPPASAIRLTSPQTRRGIPIDAPSVYNPSIIKAQAEKIIRELPEAMRSVILSSTELPASPGIDDETFITSARLLDKNYQSAARYKSVNPYRGAYTRASSQDVRGFYFLVRNKVDAEALKEVSTIQASWLTPIKESLTQICQNNGRSQSTCQSQLNEAFNANTLAQFYNQYYPGALQNWNAFFEIPSSAVRSDVTWTDSVMTVPFNTPSIAKFVPYLQNNIQDEFRFGNWLLRLNFGSYFNGPRLKFEAGVVPHVNGLGGNEIVMDSNQPIEEYESQWTIRHEFGHVLGLPDCYHEFYDTKLQAFVNYQLDITDLMCSRAGNMKERIFTELKKAYGK